MMVVFSSLAGFLALAPATTIAASGDMTISEPMTISNTIFYVDGDVVIQAGGTLTVQDAELRFLSDSSNHHVLTVDGGNLVLDNGKITTYLDSIHTYPYLTLTVQGGGKLTATDGSVLGFPGAIAVSGTTSSVELWDANITTLDLTLLSYLDPNVVGDPNDADDGPIITISNAAWKMYDSTIYSLPEYTATTGGNISLLGSAKFTAVNSYIDIDFKDEILSNTTHNAITLDNTARAYLYGCNFEPWPELTPYGSSAIVPTAGDTAISLPTAKTGFDNTSGQSVDSLWVEDDGMSYHATTKTNMSVNTFDIVGLPANPSAVSMIIKYSVSPSYNGNRPVYYRNGATYASTTVTPAVGQTNVVYVLDMLARGIDTLAEINSLAISFYNSGTGGDVQFDAIYMVVSVGPQAYVYRWADINVTDMYGAPLKDATITAKFAGSSELLGKTCYYYTPTGLLYTPPSDVYSTYLGKTVTSYKMTDSTGNALIPYLSDIITGDSLSNSLFVGDIEITATSGAYNASTLMAFSPYPRMGADDASTTITISIDQAVAGGLDPSKYLIVPTDKTISGGNYTHNGDVIARTGGTLTLQDTSFFINREIGETSSVVIGDNGEIAISGSIFDSNQPVLFEVRDGGILTITDSTIGSNVDIVIYGDADVEIVGSTIEGTITADSSSTTSFEISDSTLDNLLTIGGSTKAILSNVSIGATPSILVTETAKVSVYRWAMVTVLDGTGAALPGANVYARGQLNGTLVKTAVSNSNGLAGLRLLAFNVTASGIQYTGNYNLSAIYTYASQSFPSGFSKPSLATYSTPLTVSNPVISMPVPGALPDLDPPIAVTPAPSISGGTSTVSTTISNHGVVTATNILVYFYDSLDTTFEISEKFAEVTIASIAPGASVPVTVDWSAPLVPGDNRYVAVEIDPFNTTPEINEGDNLNWTLVTIVGRADLTVSGIGLYTTPSLLTEGDPTITVNLQMTNTGDADAGLFTVDFYYEMDSNPGTLVLIGTDTLTNGLDAGQSTVAGVNWPNSPAGSATLYAMINQGHAVIERSYADNNASLSVLVRTRVDLTITNMLLSFNGQSNPAEVWSSNEVAVTIYINNNGETPVLSTQSIMVAIYNQSVSAANLIEYKVLNTQIALGSPAVPVTFILDIPRITTPFIPWTYWAVVNPSTAQGGTPVPQSDESDYTNNADSVSFNVIDSRPDLSIVSADISIRIGTTDISEDNNNVSYGDALTIIVTVRNIGLSSADEFSVSLNLSGAEATTVGNTPIGVKYTSLNSSLSSNVTFTYTVVARFSGKYTMNVTLDLEGAIDDKNRSNNVAFRALNVSYIQPYIVINMPSENAVFAPSQSVIIEGLVQYPDHATPMRNVTVSIVITDLSGTSVTSTVSLTTSSSGDFTTSIVLPQNIASGQYVIHITVGNDSAIRAITVQEPGIPLWMLIAIAGAILGGVLAFSFFIYKQGMGKLVECGECGALIPESAKKCPKCGVEFEEDMVKCSECGAWIASDSIECPNCHVRFGTPLEGEKSYADKMRDQYDQDVVSKYRDLAKAELGKDFNEDIFKEWWAANPAYISFEDWLAKEEERRKQANLLTCPVCGTLNAKDETICNNCGSPLQAQAEGAVSTAPIGTMPDGTVVEKRVIRKPIDRKMVPKKVIKKPIDQDQQQQQGGQQQQ